MWEIITAILFIIGWIWVAYEMYVAPYKDELWGENKIDITDEEVMTDLNHGTEVTQTDDHS
jgi:hypothetical protein